MYYYNSEGTGPVECVEFNSVTGDYWIPLEVEPNDIYLHLYI